MIHLIQLKNGKQYKIGDAITLLPTPPKDGEENLGIKIYTVMDLIVTERGYNIMLQCGEEVRVRHLRDATVAFHDTDAPEVEWEEE